jgi:hypothetical protein
MVLSETIEDQAREALTIADHDFLIAMVLRQDAPTSSTFFALAPREPADSSAMTLLSLQPALELVLASAGARTVIDTTATPSAGPHLVVVLSQGPRLVVRLDGQEIGMRPFGRLAGEKMDGTLLSLPFLIPFVGAWDLDLPGLSGLVGDVVVVAGDGVAAATAPLEDYLKKKYGFSSP